MDEDRVVSYILLLDRSKKQFNAKKKMLIIEASVEVELYIYLHIALRIFSVGREHALRKEADIDSWDKDPLKLYSFGCHDGFYRVFGVQS